MEELIALIKERFGVEVGPGTPLTDTGLSSLDMLELAVRIEERFNIRIDEDLYAQSHTIQDVADYVEAKQ